MASEARPVSRLPNTNNGSSNMCNNDLYDKNLVSDIEFLEQTVSS
jgi:hypothetical protein